MFAAQNRRTARTPMFAVAAMVFATATATATAAVAGSPRAPSPAAASAPGRVTTRVVARFNPAAGQNPENLAVGPDGSVYVTWLFAHAVARLMPGRPTSVVVLPGVLTSGVALDPRRPDRITVAVISSDTATAGLWTVPTSAFDGNGTTSRSVPLAADAFPNGITYAPDGTVYVADSALSRIWRIGAGQHLAQTWLSSPLLAPTGETFHGVRLPGANGVKLHDGALYVSNTAQRTLLRIPLQHGRPAVVQQVVTGVAIDDFAITPTGTVVAALNISNQVVRIQRNGVITLLADLAGQDIENPSAVAIDCDRLLVTDAAYFASPAHPALISLHVTDADSDRSTVRRAGP